jgi:hypothetical protein
MSIFRTDANLRPPAAREYPTAGGLSGRTVRLINDCCSSAASRAARVDELMGVIRFRSSWNRMTLRLARMLTSGTV